MHRLKITQVGSSAGVILPKDVLRHLRLERGDEVFLTEAPDGSFRITPYDPEFERQMELAEKVMREDRAVLKALSK